MTMPDQNGTFVDHNDTYPDANGTFVDSNVTYPDANGSYVEANTTMLDKNGTFVDMNDTFVDSNATYSEHNQTIAPADSKSRPLARTLQVELNSDGRLALKGRILPDGDTALTEVGFLLSRSLFADLNTLEAVRVEGTLSGDIITASSAVPDFGKRFYYRAYAINAEGNNLGLVKLFVMPELVLPQAWWANADEAEAGWRISPWFGAFLPYENGWVYHAELGWLYVQSDGVNGLWLWSEGHGWLWTNPGSYRYLYRSSSSEWIYFLKHKDGQAYFYNYTTGLVE